MPETFILAHLLLKYQMKKHAEVNWIDSGRLTKFSAGLGFAQSRTAHAQPRGCIVPVGLPGAGAGWSYSKQDSWSHNLQTEARKVRWKWGSCCFVSLPSLTRNLDCRSQDVWKARPVMSHWPSFLLQRQPPFLAVDGKYYHENILNAKTTSSFWVKRETNDRSFLKEIKRMY